MAAPVNLDEFLELVRKSGVADEKRLDAYLLKGRASLPPDPAQAARSLIENGLITNFQADNLLAGKWKRFSIGKYKILEKLGSGGMAQVFLCEHKLMRRRVAVKVLPTAKAKDPAALERFIREARAVAALDHPNIVHAYDIDQDDDLHFLVMEFVDGTNLQDLIKKVGPLDVPRACHYIRQTALALQHAHEAGLVHRDVKPGNILVDRAGGIKVLDMGLARFFHDEEDVLTKKYDENVLGTADYLSPEQALDSHAVDIRADIYSLGATFYFLLTGRAPFESANAAQKLMMHQFKQPRPISEIRNDVPAPLIAIIDKMMAKDPNHRFATPGELADALDAFTTDVVAPPSEVEIPRLSLAASGSTPGSNSPVTAVTKNDAPSMLAAKTPPPARSASDAQVGTPRAVAIAPGTPVPVAKSLPVADEEAPWVPDENDLGPSRSKHKPKAPPTSRSLWLLLFVVLIIVPVFAVVVIGAVVWLFFPEPASPPPPPGPPKLEVSKHRAGAFRSIQVALKEAKIGSIIELHDEVHEENVVIEPSRGRPSVILQAAAGKEILWRSSKSDIATPLLKTYKAVDFKIKGAGITMDGTIDAKRRANELILITGDSSGMLIEDLSLKSFGRSAVLIMNATGNPQRPLQLRKLSITSAPTEKPRAAIYLDANPSMTPEVNDNVEIHDCTFAGIDAKNAIRTSNPKVIGKNVHWEAP